MIVVYVGITNKSLTLFVSKLGRKSIWALFLWILIKLSYFLRFFFSKVLELAFEWKSCSLESFIVRNISQILAGNDHMLGTFVGWVLLGWIKLNA